MSHVTANDASTPRTPSALRQRLLQDIAELQSKPYPNIALHVSDENFNKACLWLNVEAYGPMHLTVEFPPDYPLKPPTMSMDSDVNHPNIFDNYICASILNTTEGYTPAYTLKGIAIQMLSFFGSDRVEQQYNSRLVDLKDYKMRQKHLVDSFTCTKCKFGMSDALVACQLCPKDQVMVPLSGEEDDLHWPTLAEAQSTPSKRKKGLTMKISSSPPKQCETIDKEVSKIQHAKLPDEILLLICEKLETEDLMAFAQAWDRIGTIMTAYDVIRTRELQCFCLKKDYLSTKLGVGVTTYAAGGKKGFLESEFDLLSKEAFDDYHINRSVLGVKFEHFLPLPISRRHWSIVKNDVLVSLEGLVVDANWGLSRPASPIDVVYHFMNDVVVKLNKTTADNTYRIPQLANQATTSTLTHASEKAIESYFHLFHLLLCIATDQPSTVTSAKDRLTRFMNGETSKEVCPNLGHLLVTVLISDCEINEALMKAIVKEAITRNVVWMLDKKGTNMPELAFFESSPVSEYRLKKTFEASKTSYRLLMFLNLFRKTAVGSPRKPLTQLRDEAFDRHGAPPRGSAKNLADSIKQIHAVNTFPEFLASMGIEIPTAEWFTTFLRTCIEDSMKKGYSSMPISQRQALYLRREKEPDVKVPENSEKAEWVSMERHSFFPRKAGSISQNTGRGRGSGRERGRGRGQ